ncbi:MAG: hypothetical protein EXS35_04835 [Pedosphaera sp.]|nr:hypothetical protein [Pedosphaera sp.]
MNHCPACKKEITPGAGDESQSCPHCGFALVARDQQRPLNGWIFFPLLLAPPVIGLLGALARIEALAIGGPVFGGGLAGIVCGIMLARRVGRMPGMQVALAFLFVPLLGFVSFILGFFGCMLGGFQINMR